MQSTHGFTKRWVLLLGRGVSELRRIDRVLSDGRGRHLVGRWCRRDNRWFVLVVAGALSLRKNLGTEVVVAPVLGHGGVAGRYQKTGKGGDERLERDSVGRRVEQARLNRRRGRNLVQFVHRRVSRVLAAFQWAGAQGGGGARGARISRVPLLSSTVASGAGKRRRS